MVAAPGLFDQEVSFFVSGDPVPKARPRFAVTRNGRHVAYTPKGSAAWEKAITVVATAVRMRGEIPWPLKSPGPYGCHIIIRSNKKRRSDLDNFCKSCLDAMNGIVYDDDSSIDELYARFEPIEDEADCGAWIRVWRKE